MYFIRLLYFLCLIWCIISSLCGFFDLPPTCNCEQLGVTQGLACSCRGVEGSFPSGFPQDVAKMTFESCSLFNIPSGVFSGLELLEEINFKYTKIVAIESGAFDSLSSIALITFQGYTYGDTQSLITTIESGAFTNLKFSRGTTGGMDNGILFSSIKIGTIEKNAFEGISGLSQLAVRRTEITSVSDEAFSGVENIVEFQMYNIAITDQVFQPFQKPVSFITFIINKLQTPVLSPFMIPSEATELEFTNSNVDTIECGLFVDGMPVEMTWEENQVICDCRLNWVFGNEDGNNALPDEVIDSFSCKGPASAIGKDLGDYRTLELPCSGVESISTCSLYEDGIGFPILAVVIPLVFIAVATVIIILAILMYRKYRRHEDLEKQVQRPQIGGTYKPVNNPYAPPELPPNHPGDRRPMSEGNYDVLDEYSMYKIEDSNSVIKPSSQSEQSDSASKRSTDDGHTPPHIQEKRDTYGI